MSTHAISGRPASVYLARGLAALLAWAFVALGLWWCVTTFGWMADAAVHPQTQWDLTIYGFVFLNAVGVISWLCQLAVVATFRPNGQSLRVVLIHGWAGVFFVGPGFLVMRFEAVGIDGDVSSWLMIVLLFPTLCAIGALHRVLFKQMSAWAELPDTRPMAQRIADARLFLQIAGGALWLSLFYFVREPDIGLTAGGREYEAVEALRVLGPIVAALVAYKVAVWIAERRIRARHEVTSRSGRSVEEQKALRLAGAGGVG